MMGGRGGRRGWGIQHLTYIDFTNPITHNAVEIEYYAVTSRHHSRGPEHGAAVRADCRCALTIKTMSGFNLPCWDPMPTVWGKWCPFSCEWPTSTEAAEPHQTQPREGLGIAEANRELGKGKLIMSNQCSLLPNTPPPGSREGGGGRGACAPASPRTRDPKGP